MLNRGLTDEQILIVRQHTAKAIKSSHNETRYFAIFLEVLIATGCRKDELCNIHPIDIDMAYSTINIVRPAKGSEKRSPRVNPELLKQLLHDCIAMGVEKNSSIVNLVSRSGVAAKKKKLERMWKELRESLLGESFRLGLHCFRHTAARLIDNATGNMLYVQRFLGHKSLQSTAIYLKHIEYSEASQIMFNIVNKGAK